MAEKLYPSRKGGAFHFDVNDDPPSVSKTPSFSDFSIKTGSDHIPAPPPLPPPSPRRGWVSVAELTSSDQTTDDRSVQQPSGTYVVQFPKEQIFSYPPPENSIKFETLSRRKPRRSPCCICLRYTLVFFFILVILAATAAAILYLIYKPVEPDYTISSISINGFNLTSSSIPSFSPTIDVSIQAENPNKNLGIYYLAAGGNEVSVSYQGTELANGVLPEFFQPAKNLTVLQSALKGSNVALTDGIRSTMMKEQNEKNVALRLDVKAPVKMKAGALKTWTIKVKLRCDFTVDSLDENSKILSKKCDYKFKLF